MSEVRRKHLWPSRQPLCIFNQLGCLALVASLLILFVVAFLFITKSLIPWSNSCPLQLGVDPAGDAPTDAEVIAYESSTPTEQTVLNDVLASSSMILLGNRP